MNQAPKGGMTVAGVFYKGGQFLPSNNEPKRGAFNGKSGTKAAKAIKVLVGMKEYAEPIEGKRSIYQWVAGTVAQYSWFTKRLTYVGNELTLAYAGLTETKALELIKKWNEGERWV